MAKFLISLEDGTEFTIYAYKAIDRTNGEVAFYEGDGRSIVALYRNIQFRRIDDANPR